MNTLGGTGSRIELSGKSGAHPNDAMVARKPRIGRLHLLTDRRRRIGEAKRPQRGFVDDRPAQPRLVICRHAVVREITGEVPTGK